MSCCLCFVSFFHYFFFFFFFFNDTATTEIYTLSLHDALPICGFGSEVVEIIRREELLHGFDDDIRVGLAEEMRGDRKSTRLNSSHPSISYAVFCLKKKKKKKKQKDKKYKKQKMRQR